MRERLESAVTMTAAQYMSLLERKRNVIRIASVFLNLRAHLLQLVYGGGEPEVLVSRHHLERVGAPGHGLGLAVAAWWRGAPGTYRRHLLVVLLLLVPGHGAGARQFGGVLLGPCGGDPAEEEEEHGRGGPRRHP